MPNKAAKLRNHEKKKRAQYQSTLKKIEDNLKSLKN